MDDKILDMLTEIKDGQKNLEDEVCQFINKLALSECDVENMIKSIKFQTYKIGKVEEELFGIRDKMNS